MDNRLKWQAQVEGTILKASRVLNLLRRTMKDCSMDVKKKAYTALVCPLLEYAAPAWSPHLHRDIDMLEKVQKRAARWVCGTSWDTQHQRWFHSYSDLCHKLKWISLHNRRTLLCHYQTYKIVHSIDCIHLTITSSSRAEPSGTTPNLLLYSETWLRQPPVGQF